LIAWSGLSVWLLPLSLVLPITLGLARTRQEAGLAACAYFAAALLPMTRSAAVFFHALASGLGWLLWTLCTAGYGLFFAAIWFAGYPLVSITGGLILHALSPFGLASPLLAAGTLFPRAGFVGLLLLLSVIVLWTMERRRWAFGVLIAASTVCLIFNRPVRLLPDWKAVDTHLGGNGFHQNNGWMNYDAIQLMNSEHTAAENVIVFPENHLSVWDDQLIAPWLATGQKTEIVGAVYRGEKSVIVWGPHRDIYVARLPVPLAEWGNGAKPHWFGRSTVQVDGYRAAVFLCYEQLLVLPELESFSKHAQVVIAPSNLYWARNTNLNRIQMECLTAWSRLFRVPVVRAVNF